VGQVFDGALTRRSEITYEFRSRAFDLIILRQVGLWKIVFLDVISNPCRTILAARYNLHRNFFDFAIWRF